jgi:RNA polymerase sigma factor (sigma-70 family)
MVENEQKPDFNEVYKYAMESVSYNIRKIAAHLPNDQKEEIQQEAAIRVWKAYKVLDIAKGWKSFIQRHTKGTVQDYLKLGHGNIEDGFVSNEAMDGLKFRVDNLSIFSDSDESDSVENVLALNGVHSESQNQEEKIKPNWDLLSRMAGNDEDLHIVCKMLLGYSQRQIAEQYSQSKKGKISRERISQRIREFFGRLDNCEFYHDEWKRQCIFALGLSSYYNTREFDNRQGWNLKAFNLCSPDSFQEMETKAQGCFFDFFPECYPIFVSRKLIPPKVRVKRPKQAKIHQLSFIEDDVEKVAL